MGGSTHSPERSGVASAQASDQHAERASIVCARPARERGSNAPAWWLTGVQTAMAIALWVFVVEPNAAPLETLEVPWWVLALAFAASEALVIQIDVGEDRHGISLSEIPLLLGIIFCSPGGLLAARLLGGAFALGVVSRLPAAKFAFNLAMIALDCTAALAAYELVLTGAAPMSPRGWVAGLAAVATGSIVSWLAVVVVIRLVTGELDRDGLRSQLRVGGLVALLNASCALLAAFTVWFDPRGAWVLVVLSFGLALGYRGYTRLRQRFANVDLLYRFIGAIDPSLPGGEVLGAILERARSLMGAGRASLVIAGDDGAVMRWSLGQELEGPERLSVLPARITQFLEGAEGDLTGESAGSRDITAPAAWLAGPETHQAMAAGFRGPQGVVGALVVADPSDEPFDADDLKVLQAMARHTAVALGNGRLMDRLHEQIAANRRLAVTDVLTETHNRLGFMQELVGLTGEATEQRLLALAVLDLDGFKEVNDALGHAVGDHVLQQVATRLARHAPANAVVARLGGDEFAVAVPGVDSPAVAMAFVTELMDALERPVDVRDVSIDVRVCGGIALAPLHGHQPEDLLRRADVAMYTAQRSRSRVRLYQPGHDEVSARSVALVGELRRAIDDDQLTLYYQPQIDLASGAVIGVEALSRWPHHRHGFVTPDEFMPLAEQSGLVRPLALWCVRKAVDQLAAWRAEGMDLTIAVNLSTRNLTDIALPDEVERLLHEHDVPPQSLTLEITESALMDDLERSLGVLTRLSAAGMRIAIDDFGTGHSSLGQLKRLPVDEIKIDKAFIRNLLTDQADTAIVRSIIDLADNLGMMVIAEGVEQPEVFTRLAALGCHAAQGHNISRALPAPRLRRWIDTWPGGVGRTGTPPAAAQRRTQLRVVDPGRPYRDVRGASPQ